MLKATVREFDDKIKTDFFGNNVPKQNMHYTCIACITIDSAMRMQVYLEECKYRVKNIQMSRFKCLDSVLILIMIPNK